MANRRHRQYNRQIRAELILLTFLLLRLGLQGLCFALDFIKVQPTNTSVIESAESTAPSITINQCPFQVVIPLPTQE